MDESVGISVHEVFNKDGPGEWVIPVVAHFLSLEMSMGTAGMRERSGELGKAWDRNVWMSLFALV